MNNKNSGTIILGLTLAAGISLSGYFISQTLYKSKVAINVAEVKGLAERKIKADTAVWKLDFTISDDATTSLKSLYAAAESRQSTIVDYLLKAGFNKNDIEIGTIDYTRQEFRDHNQKLVEQRQNLTGSITVNTQEVDLVASVRSGVNSLIAQGIAINNYTPRYLFTQLNDVKPAMLRQATENARIAANEFAQIAKVQVGGIRHARQGSFLIRDSGEQYTTDNKIEKDVRVVTTITFYLTE